LRAFGMLLDCIQKAFEKRSLKHMFDYAKIDM